MSKPEESYVKLAGGNKEAPTVVQGTELNSAQPLEVTIRIRRKTSIGEHLVTNERFTREEY